MRHTSVVQAPLNMLVPALLRFVVRARPLMIPNQAQMEANFLQMPQAGLQSKAGFGLKMPSCACRSNNNNIMRCGIA